MLEKMSVQELKAYVYDASKTIQRLQMEIQAIEQELAKRAVGEEKQDASEQ